MPPPPGGPPGSPLLSFAPVRREPVPARTSACTLASGLQTPAPPSANAEANAEPALLPLSAELADAGARANGCDLRSFHAVCVAIRPLGRSDGTGGAGVMITLADEPSANADRDADDAGRWRVAELMLDYGAMPAGAELYARELMGVRPGASVECRRAPCVGLYPTYSRVIAEL